jgi:hypothetical protein
MPIEDASDAHPEPIGDKTHFQYKCVIDTMGGTVFFGVIIPNTARSDVTASRLAVCDRPPTTCAPSIQPSVRAVDRSANVR